MLSQKSQSLIKDIQNNDCNRATTNGTGAQKCSQFGLIIGCTRCHAVSCRVLILLRVHNVMNACTKDILMNTYYVGHSDILKKHWELGLFASAAVVTTASICMCSSIVHHLSWPQELIRLCWKLFITSKNISDSILRHSIFFN